MPAQPFTRRARWIGGAFALAVLAIGTRFIVAARFSACLAPATIDVALLRLALVGPDGGAMSRDRRKVVP